MDKGKSFNPRRLSGSSVLLGQALQHADAVARVILECLDDRYPGLRPEMPDGFDIALKVAVRASAGPATYSIAEWTVREATGCRGPTFISDYRPPHGFLRRALRSSIAVAGEVVRRLRAAGVELDDEVAERLCVALVHATVEAMEVTSDWWMRKSQVGPDADA